MIATPPALPSAIKPRKRLSVGLQICLMILGILLILATWNAIWRIGNARAVARLDKSVHDRGEPVNLAELAATYLTIRDANNVYAALEDIWLSEDPEYWKAFRAGENPLPEQKPQEDTRDLPYLNLPMSHTNKLDSDTMQKVQTFLAAKASHMSRVREALNRKDFRARVKIEDGFAAILPHCRQMQREARLFQVEALQASELGQIESAIDAISLISRTGHCLDEDPFLIGQLVRLTIYTMSLDSAERLLSQRQLNNNELNRLHDILHSLNAQGGLEKSLVGERAVDLDAFSGTGKSQAELVAMAAGDDPNSSPGSLNAVLIVFRLVGLDTADKRLMAETYEKISQCLSNSNFATNDSYDQIFDHVVVQAKAMPPKVITAMLMPPLKKVGGKFTRVEALRRCSETAICVERYRLKHGGTLPANLADIPADFLPAIPNDPFDGQPLRYKQLPTGFEIYSVGPDREDNDGYVPSQKKDSSAQGSDVGFRVERLSTH